MQDELAVGERVLELEVAVDAAHRGHRRVVAQHLVVDAALARAGERRVGLLQDALGPLVGLGGERDADLPGDTQRAPVEDEGVDQRGGHALGDVLGRLLGGEVLGEHREAVGGQARDGVGRTQRGRQAPRDLDDEPVEAAVADALGAQAGAVERQQPDGQRRAAALGALGRLLDAVEQQRAVRQRGEDVVRAQHAEPELVLLALDRVAHRARERRRAGTALDDVVLRAVLDDHAAGRLVAGPDEHDDRRLRRGAADLDERVQAAHVGQAEVEQHAVGDSVLEVLARLGDGLDVADLELGERAVGELLGDQ